MPPQTRTRSSSSKPKARTAVAKRTKPPAAAGRRAGKRTVYTKEQLRKLFVGGGGTVEQCCDKMNTVLQHEACATLGVAPSKLASRVGLSKRCPDCLEPAQAFEWLFKHSHALKALTHRPPDNIYAVDAFRDAAASERSAVSFAPWFWLLMGTRARNHYMNTYDQHHPTNPFPRTAFRLFSKRAHNCCVKANARYPGTLDALQ